MKKTYLFGYLSILIVFLGCEGEMGSQGIPGINNLIALSEESIGTNCENGGVRVDMGLDENENAVLDANEVQTSNYICNGIDGLVSLTNVVVESIGDNCPNGGFRINSGLDSNFNGSLEENEITANAFLCNGLDGGNVLIRTNNEPIGENCSNGGIKIDSGIDGNGNSVLDEMEVTSSTFLCNGEDGNISLVNLTKTPTSVECPNGGVILDSGVDDNSNGILDDSEIQLSSNVCNGLDGDFNEEIRLVFLSGTLGSSYGTTSTEGNVLSSLQRFDIRRFKLLKEAIFITRSWTDDNTNSSFVELIRDDIGEVVPNSILSTNFTSHSGEVLISPNLFEDFPQEEITLSLRIRSENDGVPVYLTGRTELILTRNN